ncbi:unnamed protein product [Acanthoscelides obtectus]|uniref:Angiotensin-converting enzyme n=1 Tax=Acanthoscelides obtectus TaxID=200917 RepID=A0A9P0LB11_ACAOB|nr:unnamed protein product [Acanthoscelides obtectus]CAK1684010.1 Angiotensin-converting enzyme [Acanthoscelides obtectus]
MLVSSILVIFLLNFVQCKKLLLTGDVLTSLNVQLQELMHLQKLATWDYETNLTDFNLAKKLEMDVNLASFQKQASYNLSKYKWKSERDGVLQRERLFYLRLEEEILPPKKYKRLKEIMSKMIHIYSTAKICDYSYPTKCDLALLPEDELRYTWIERRKAVGPKVRDLFQEYVQLVNEAAQKNGYDDASEYYLREHTDPDIKKKLKHYNRRLRSLYEQLHAYVRFKLRKKYGNSTSEIGSIPAHLLGDLTAQKWSGIAQVTLPYPEPYENFDNLKQQNYTVTDIARLAEDFYKSLNLSKMPNSFWRKSVFQKLTDTNMTCNPSAWDFYDGQNFRLKTCLKTDREGYETLHHWMGHIQYFLQYQGLDIKLRNAATDALFDSVGGAFSLAAFSLKHLKRVGLYRGEISTKADINNLYTLAMSKIVSVPATYAILKWKDKILSGEVKSEDYNSEWWKLVLKYQGVQPPVPRFEDDFDPGNIFEIISGESIWKKFTSLILQFQIFRQLCETDREFQIFDKASQLHTCDIYQSVKAGAALRTMMAYGKKKPWGYVMKHFLSYGRLFDELNPVPMLEYFQPLYEWLEKENQKNGVFVGWIL